MRGGKYYFSVERDEALPEFDRKPPTPISKKTKSAKRKIARRRAKFTSDVWYEKAVLSIKIRGET